MTRLRSLCLVAAAALATALTFIPLALTFAGAASSAEFRAVCADADSLQGELDGVTKNGGKYEVLDEAQSKRWLGAYNSQGEKTSFSADIVIIVTNPAMPDMVSAIFLFAQHGMACGPLTASGDIAKAAMAAAKGQGM
jgi:hypothetical protein